MARTETSELKGVGKRIMKLGEQQGADETEAYVVSNRVLTVRLANNAVFESKGVHDIGVGVRVIAKRGMGFSSTADFSPKSIKKAVQAALNTSKARKLRFKYSFPSPSKPPRIPGLYDTKLANLLGDKAVELAYDMVEESMEQSRKIADNSGVLNVVEFHAIVMNSNGLVAKEEGTFFEASLTATAKEGDKSSEGAESTAGRSLKELKPKEIGKKAAEMAVDGLKAERLKEGTYSILLDPEPTAAITEYVEFLTCPSFARKEYPLFLDKIGKSVGSRHLTVIDDPLMAGGVRSSPIDQEGIPSQKFTIIDKGVLKTFAYDSYYGAVAKKKTSASAFRRYFVPGLSWFPGRNYDLEPIARTRNPHMAQGDWKRSEIIEDTKDGLLARRFHYTRITNPTRGDFTSVLRMGLYRIEKGEVTCALQKSRIRDNYLNMLKSIDSVSDKLVVAGSWGAYVHAPTVRTKAYVTPV